MPRGDKKAASSNKREMTIRLNKLVREKAFKKRAPQAVKAIRQIVSKQFFTDDVRINVELNKAIWHKGVRNVPNRVRISVERKSSEEEEGATHCLVSLVKGYNNPQDFRGKTTVTG